VSNGSEPASPWVKRGAVMFLLIVATAAWFIAQPVDRGDRPQYKKKTDHSAAQVNSELKTVLEDVTVRSYNNPVYKGRIDLSATIDRIKRGERHPHRNDGSTFHNREKRLPKQAGGYYREFVHPTEGMRGPGPQRIVVGKGGEWYYSPDHYRSFIKLNIDTSGARPPPK